MVLAMYATCMQAVGSGQCLLKRTSMSTFGRGERLAKSRAVAIFKDVAKPPGIRSLRPGLKKRQRASGRPQPRQLRRTGRPCSSMGQSAFRSAFKRVTKCLLSVRMYGMRCLRASALSVRMMSLKWKQNSRSPRRGWALVQARMAHWTMSGSGMPCLRTNCWISAFRPLTKAMMSASLHGLLPAWHCAMSAARILALMRSMFIGAAACSISCLTGEPSE
mmetsp:Transcript_125137/g.325100  ORF Transcript_125137/g.325100 Transcript_125137/m.325100 type:complete len:219 (-) Transcript_125137:906-1562(-)